MFILFVRMNSAFFLVCLNLIFEGHMLENCKRLICSPSLNKVYCIVYFAMIFEYFSDLFCIICQSTCTKTDPLRLAGTVSFPFRKIQVFHFAKCRFSISQSTDFPFRKVQIFHFAKYRFSISHSTDFPFHFVPFRFVSFRFAKYNKPS